MYYTNGNTGILRLHYSLCSKDVLQYRRLIEKRGEALQAHFKRTSRHVFFKMAAKRFTNESRAVARKNMPALQVMLWEKLWFRLQSVETSGKHAPEI